MDPRLFDEPTSTAHIRELPQLQSLRIGRIRHVPSIPFPLEPNASGGVHETNKVPAANLPTLTELLNAARTKNTTTTTTTTTTHNDTQHVVTMASEGSRIDSTMPPRPILPAFVNLRALERVPYSFHEDGNHLNNNNNNNTNKRRRVDDDSFGQDHLQLPIPQAHKEPRPRPPFGPFAIVNGLNEPPPNAALLPPIESGSVARLLARPTKDGSNVSISPGKSKREGRIEEILDAPVDDDENDNVDGRIDNETNEMSNESKSRDVRRQLPGLSDTRNTRGPLCKNQRKWSEEETACLLKGALKLGIGNWTEILAQPDLKFNKRSATNLKDRYE